MVYVVEKLPINEDLVERILFPKTSAIDDPEELIEQKLVIVDTRFIYVTEFEKLALKFRGQGMKCGLITNLPSKISREEVECLQAFNFVFIFDEYPLLAKPFVREATRRSIEQILRSDLSFLPKFASIGYTEIRFQEDNLPHALIALQEQKDSFNSCPPVSQRAKSNNQYKNLISCPYYLEVKVQECLENTVIVDEASETIKVSRLYWLTDQQILHITDQHDGTVLSLPTTNNPSSDQAARHMTQMNRNQQQRDQGRHS